MEIEISPIQLSPGRVIFSRALSVLMALAAAVLVIVYAMNVWCMSSDAKRPMLVGNIWHESTKGAEENSRETWGKTGVSRVFIEADPKENTGFVTLGGTRIALANMGVGGWVAYFVFLSLALMVGLLFFVSLARLFHGFSQGRIFTRESIRQIQMTGIAVLLGGGLQFFSLLFAIWINASASHSTNVSGQIYGGNLEFPLGPLACAVMIILTAMMFEEGRKLSEEASLTI